MKSYFEIIFKILSCKFRKTVIPDELETLYDKWLCFNLSVVGLWPYQSRIEKRVFYGCFLASSLSIIVALIAGLTDKWSTEPLIILENIVAVMFVGIGVIACTVVYKEEDKMKEFYETVTIVRQHLTDENEVRIFKSFHQEEVTTAFAILIYSVPAFFVFSAITFYPSLRTTSKDYNHVFPYYYSRMVIIESMRFYQIVAHTCISLIYTSLALLAIRCAFVGSISHICANFAIVSYKLENLEKCSSKFTLHELKRNRIIISKLTTVINKHKEAIHLVRLIEDISSRGNLVIQLVALFVVALVMADIVCSNDSPWRFLRSAVVSGIFLFYLLHVNFAAEQVIQVSLNIGTSAYFVDWINMSVEVRKLLCMIIMRSSKSEKLTAGSVMTMSNAASAGFLRTCWTFATVLLSSQRRLKHVHV